jgi:hypothetical protein
MHARVGALTALAFVLIIGRADRFRCGKQIGARDDTAAQHISSSPTSDFVNLRNE